MTITSYDALLEWAANTPDRVFLNQPFEDGVLQWTWQQAASDASCLASGLLGLGLQKGDKVALLSKNCAEWIIADVAMTAAGLVSVPIYPTAGGDTIRHVMDHSEAKAIFVGKLDDPDVPAAVLDPKLPRIALRYPSMECQYQWQDLIDGSEELQQANRPGGGDVMTILYTSGSTGKASKGVRNQLCCLPVCL